MLGVSGMLGSSSDGPAATEGGAGPSSGEDERTKFEDSERNSGGGGNRWPRQETLALLKIRSDMDSAFRDSSLKGPLWDEVSRKLAELGYHRNAKKCKEKFENVYKYHKRTKDGRSTKSEGKTYRFFDQLEALDQNQPSSQFPPLPSPPQQQRSQNQGPESPTPVAMAMPTSIHCQIFPQVTIASAPIVPTNASRTLNSPITLPSSNPSPPTRPPVPTTNATVMTNTKNTKGMLNNTNATPNHGLNQNLNTNLEFDFGSSSPSSSEGEEDPERRKKRKRKWESFFQKLMSEVIQKQEQMQKDFLETLERREREHVAREEAWRAQEMARMNQEHELLAQERSMAATKDSAVIAYLQKISDQNQQTPTQIQTQTKVQKLTLQGKESSIPNPNSALVPIPTANPNLVRMPVPPPPQPPPQQLQIQPYDNARNGNHVGGASSSRWPKAEVQALIQLRTNMDIKYQDNGPKGPLWEEISAEMKKIGYDRNAKRCKEKWENINKYFKKVKESNKKRPEDSKTCPYFHLLDQIYRERAKGGSERGNSMVPMMVQPEQQWPQPLDQKSDETDGEDEEEEERVGSGYEIVTNKGGSGGA